MIRFLAATFVVACLAPSVFGQSPKARIQGGQIEKPKRSILSLQEEAAKPGRITELYRDSQGRPQARVIESPELLRKQYLELAKQMSEQLSEEEVREEFARLREKQTAIRKEQERNRVADEIEKRLMADVEFLQKISEEQPGTEAASVAARLRETLIGEIGTIRRWKSGGLHFPPPDHFSN